MTPRRGISIISAIFYRFFDDHADELLRGGDDDDAIHREGLEYGKGDIAGAGGHIDEHEVHVLPVDIGPELADRPGNDRAAPDDGIAFLLQQQVDGHDLGTEAGDGGQHDLAEAFGLFPDAERLRDAGTGDIGIEDGGAVAQPLHTDGQQTGDEGCLSVPGMAGQVTRPNYVKVKAQDEDMNEVEYEGEGLLARAFCHELDHLDGHMYTELVEGELHHVSYDEEEE